MNSTGRLIAKNASVLMGSQVITWGLTLLQTIFLPRYLGAESMGKFYLANSLWAIIGMFAAFGMDTMIIKAVARNRDKAPELFGTTLYLRTALYALGSVAMVIYCNAAGYPDSTRYVIYIIGLANFLLQFEYACESVLKGMEQMEYISLAHVAGKFIQTTLTILLLLLKQNIYIIAGVAILSVAVQIVVISPSLRKIAGLNLRFRWSQFAWMLRESSSYLMVRLAMVMYQQVDVVIISLLVNEKNIGWYGTAGQLYGTFLFVPTVFITVLYPTLSRLFASAPDSVDRIIRKSVDLMWLLAVPVGLGVVLIADPIVVLLYGSDFKQAGPVLALFGIVTTVTYMNMLLGQILISIDRQKSWSWVIGISALLTIPLDLLFVPWCQKTFGIGALGGGLSFLVTETVMTVAALYLLPRHLLGWDSAFRALRVLAAGLIMLAAGWWLREQFLLIPIAIAALAYLASIIVLRAVPAEDWGLLRSTANALMNKIRRRTAEPVGVEGKN